MLFAEGPPEGEVDGTQWAKAEATDAVSRRDYLAKSLKLRQVESLRMFADIQSANLRGASP